ncbi:CPBP family intramembrane glutamic endopeptidase [Psychrobacter sp. I-STPA6b]|uniref:CPBP family intramembrane glutamic endopeptidase n=1 Tax=Psychrobacter sp. I-STPA6b TaxID=2585718 RepID=UPI001D0CBA99|nr:CPBP family intramembrane glutamic endopeptidase [Psychrobacter sp. I-STPA6b]
MNQPSIIPSSPTKKPLFSKLGVAVLVLGMLACFLLVQFISVAISALWILPNNQQLDLVTLIAHGSLDGTVIALSVILTLFLLSVVVGVWFYFQRYLASRRYQRPLSHFPTIFQYLEIQRFSLHTAMLMVGLLIVFVVISTVLTYWLDEDPSAFLDVLYWSAQPRWLLVLAVVVVAPIYEELVFRGILWSAISEQWVGQKGLWIASITTSVLFAMIHVQYGWYGLTTIFVLALLLSLARIKSNSLWLPIVLHIINNGFAMGDFVLSG